MVDIRDHRHVSHPLSGRALFCSFGMILLLIAHSRIVSLIMMVNSLYSTLSSVMGLNPSGVGGVLGLGNRVVMPLLQLDGKYLLEYICLYKFDSCVMWALVVCLSIFYVSFDSPGAVGFLLCMHFRMFSGEKFGSGMEVLGLDKYLRYSFMRSFLGVSEVNTCLYVWIRELLICAGFVITLSSSKMQAIWFDSVELSTLNRL